MMNHAGRRPEVIRALHYSAAAFLSATVTPQPSPTPTAFPIAEADRCVLCGLCLPHCPTYLLLEDENDSPRGRISLMRAVASGSLPGNAVVATHLSRCLGCRACERHCPSGVQYGTLLEAGRAQTFRARTPVRLVKFGLWLATRPRLLAVAAWALNLYLRSGLARLLDRSIMRHASSLRRWNNLLPPALRTASWPEFSPAQSARRGRVALFTGCLARHIDPDTIAAAIRLLMRTGYDVVIPRTQTCCGALHRDAGDSTASDALLARNHSAFAGDPVDAVIMLASGCGASLAERTTSMGLPPVMEIHEFLVRETVLENRRFAPLAQSVAVQDPCSLRNVLRSEKTVYRLLARIPGLKITPLPENDRCCGGAGAYPLREPQLASRLRDRKIEFIAQSRPDVIVSANIGCVRHLAAGLHERKLSIPLVHPVVLLERQLLPDEPDTTRLSVARHLR